MLVDSHSHFDHQIFDHDRQQVWQRAHDAGVTAQIVPAVMAKDWPSLKQTCIDYPGLYPAYGLHPMFSHNHTDEDLSQLYNWIKQEKPVAIGECGLDFYIRNPDKKRQQQIFEAQLDLANEFKLPVIIHARKAVEEVYQFLRKYPELNAVLHSYSGSIQQAERLLEMGHHFGFGGPVTYPNAKRLQQLVAEIPLESILLESDAPDQPDSQHKGQRNEPCYLTTVLQKVSEIRNKPTEEIAQQTTENAKRFFSINVGIDI